MDFILNSFISLYVDNFQDEINTLLDNGIFRKHSSGLLYCLYEPEINDFPLHTIVFFNGMSSIYHAYKLFTKETKINYRILFFQNFGRYQSTNINSNNKLSYIELEIENSNNKLRYIELEIENYNNTIETVIDLISEFNIDKPVFIGYSYGTYGTIKITNHFNSKFSGIISPFDLNSESNGMYNHLNCLQLLEESTISKFLVLYGDKDIICPKTPSLLSKSRNCKIFNIKSEHSIYVFGKYIIDNFIRLIISRNL